MTGADKKSVIRRELLLHFISFIYREIHYGQPHFSVIVNRLLSIVFLALSIQSSLFNLWFSYSKRDSLR